MVQDESHTLALLNFLGHRFYDQSDDESSAMMMSVFYKMRFKMKISYEMWRKKTSLSGLFFNAIEKTLNEMKTLATYNVQKYLNMKDGVPIYGS